MNDEERMCSESEDDNIVKASGIWMKVDAIMWDFPLGKPVKYTLNKSG